MARILVTGSMAGLGAEIFHALWMDGHEVIHYDISLGNDVRYPYGSSVLQDCLTNGLDILINNAGVNRLNWLEDVRGEEWDDVMDVNAKGIFLMSQAFLPALADSKGTILNIVSNSAHKAMRCSLAYNASKAAAHMMTLQMARELTPRHGITVFGVAPNRLAGTPMSEHIDTEVTRTRGWTTEHARAYQADQLPAGAETPPSLVAAFIAHLLSSRDAHRYLTGCILPYGA